MEKNLKNISLKMDIETILKKIGEKYAPEQIMKITGKIDEGLSILTDIEKETIKLIYGLNNGTKYTLNQIAETFNLTYERTRQIKYKAIAKLRHSAKNEKLEGLLDHTKTNLERIFLKDGKFFDEKGNEKILKKIVGKIQYPPVRLDEISIARRALKFKEEPNAYLICEKKHVGGGNYRTPVRFYKI